MDGEQTVQLELFDAFSQPVLLVQNEVVAERNKAAAAFGVRPGAAAKDVVETGPDGMPVLHLGELRVPAQVYPCAGGSVYIAEQSWVGSRLTPNALLSVAQAIRAPLTNLFTVSSPLFLALEELEDPTISRAMASLNRSFYQLLHLMCNLSDAPQTVGGQMTAAREKLELRAFVQTLFEKAQPLCEVSGFSLSCNLPERTVFVWADQKKLARAIYNLLANAMKYAPKGSMVELRLVSGKRFAVIEVHDTGSAEGRMRSTFESFSGQAFLEDWNAGEGFGLSIARAIAQAHEGTLVIGAEPAGGTTAAISISMRAPDEMQQALHAPLAKFDYTGGYRQELVELADILPAEVFDTIDVN